MPAITVDLRQVQLREIAKNHTIWCIAAYNKVQSTPFVLFNRIPDIESRDVRMEIRTRFRNWGWQRKMFLCSGKLSVKLRVLCQWKRRQMINGHCPEQWVEENIETGRFFNLNYIACVINFVHKMKYMRSVAPSRQCELYSHPFFVHFLGISGHK